MPRKTPKRASADARIERAYYAMCSGIQIDVMDIGEVFAEGHRLLDAGADEESLRIGILAFTQSIAKGPR